MFHKVLATLVLPSAISEFEARYLNRINRVALYFFALHIPVFALIAFLNDTQPGLALLLTGFVFAGPWLAFRTLDNPRSVGLVYGFTSMLMGGLLVHFGQGPVQIEMHFYFFALLAMLSVFGNPLVIVVAAVTVAVHHLALWLWLPRSVFNYDAPIWVVLVHAGFVVLESVATCYIARSFFDNVIGLEKIVQARTRQLDARNRDMRLVLDNSAQGFITIDRETRMASEQSAVLTRWFGPAVPGQRLGDYLRAKSNDYADALELGWSAVIEDILPLELTIDQLPRHFAADGRFYRVEWTPILENGAIVQALLTISDVSADFERQRLEAEQRDVLNILGRVAHDKQGVLEFFDEARDLVDRICDAQNRDLVQLKRALHTLKGNSMIFGVQSISELCHDLESQIDEMAEVPSEEERADLRTRWDMLRKSVDTLLGTAHLDKLEIDDAEYEAILHAVLRGEPHHKVATMISDWKLEPTRKRLARISEQAQSLARRLGKAPIAVRLADNDLRLDAERWASFWSAFVHAVRNAVDHGLETRDDRLARGKAPEGTIDLATRLEGDQFVIEIADDGRGIDWQAVAVKARARGLPVDTSQDLVEALFADGLSTRSEVDELSGRGVGMGAVRVACLERGGTVQLSSQGGAGTRLQFRFPKSAMSAPVQLRAAS